MSKGLLFICHGNICRSTMAERVARAMADERGLDVTVTSAGVSSEEEGNPMDHRARQLLSSHGYAVDGHRAHRVSAAEVRAADLVVAAEQRHVQALLRLAPEATNLHLVSDFDPDRVRAGEPLPDPWYGDMSDFEHTLTVLERSIPAMLDELSR